jgi:serine/threonine protein kinase
MPCTLTTSLIDLFFLPSIPENSPSPVDEVMEQPLWRITQNIASEYKVQKKIANTIQGAVYFATHIVTKTAVAIKIVSKAHVLNQTSKTGIPVAENIFQEALILTRLKGVDGVVQLFDAVEDSSFFYLVTIFESGGDLFDFLLENGKNLSEDQVQFIFRRICETVLRMHQMDMCHLDLSLENVFLTEDGDLKIGDFGVARSGDETKEGPNTSGLKIGKPKYMAPEIVSNQGFDGFQADVYSLGVILFCLLYGAHPYESPIQENLGYSLIESGCTKDFLELWKLNGKRSSNAEDLLQLFLAPAEERISLKEVLKHPWMME